MCFFCGVGKDRKKKEEKERKERKKEEKIAHEKADDPKAGADVGKIVNLMAGDANRVIIYFFGCEERLIGLFWGRYRRWCRGRTLYMGVSYCVACGWSMDD
jgi:hypothetical protein